LLAGGVLLKDYFLMIFFIVVIAILLPAFVEKQISSTKECRLYFSGIFKSKTNCLDENQVLIGYDSEVDEVICSQPVIVCN
jgi:hypothetical protein